MWVERCTACAYRGGGTASFPAQADPDFDKDVSGYFRLSDPSQFTALRELLPELQNEPTTEIIKRLRSDGLRWHIPSLKKWRAMRYQSDARDRGIEFVVVP